jgi:adenylate cyclase
MLSNTAKKVASKEGNISVGKTNSILLYIGIPNFSSFQKEKKDNEIFASLTIQTSLVAGIIMEEGGEVDKIIGERLLAVFPEKDNKHDSAKAAYTAAKRILELDDSKKLPFSVSIGINYGEVINGFLGIGNKRDFTVIGDAVNITARIEGLAENLKENRCLFSHTFNELISGDIKTEYYGEVELKGKSQPMKVYNLA